MIWLAPVESASVNHQDFLLPEKIQGKFFIIQDIELFHIHFRKDVESCLGLYTGDSGDVYKLLVDKLPLFINPSSRQDIVLYALMAALGSLDNGLGGIVRTETHIGEHFDAFNVIFGNFLVSAEDHPADTESGDHVGL